MAPEVLRGEASSDPKTDQFSWGLLAFMFLQGETAPRPDLARGGRFEPPRLDPRHASERVRAIVERTLSDDRELRFSSMADVASAVEASIQPLPRTVEQGARSAPASDPNPRFAPTRLFPVFTPDTEKRPSVSPSIREPKASIVGPFADEALAELARAVPVGFRRAVVIVTLDLEKNKARFFVQLVATDDGGDLWTPDASMDLVRAADDLIAADARDGNGRWQRLVLKLVRGVREAVVADVQ